MFTINQQPLVFIFCNTKLVLISHIPRIVVENNFARNFTQEGLRPGIKPTTFCYQGAMLIGKQPSAKKIHQTE